MDFEEILARSEDDYLDISEDEAILGGLDNIRSSRLDREREVFDPLAYNQSVLPLNAEISDAHVTKLARLLTEEMTGKMKRLEFLANREAKKLIAPFIPFSLRTEYAKYSGSFQRMPSFLYQCSEARDGIAFWLKPSLPLFFGEGEAIRLLHEYSDAQRSVLELRIVEHRETEKRRTATEMAIAGSMNNTNLRRKTYRDLYETRPAWFKILYNEILNEAKDLL